MEATSSLYIGVHYTTDGGHRKAPWITKFKGKVVGHFRTEALAARAYDLSLRAVLERGDKTMAFASNFIPDPTSLANLFNYPQVDSDSDSDSGSDGDGDGERVANAGGNGSAIVVPYGSGSGGGSSSGDSSFRILAGGGGARDPNHTARYIEADLDPYGLGLVAAGVVSAGPRSLPGILPMGSPMLRGSDRTMATPHQTNPPSMRGSTAPRANFTSAKDAARALLQRLFHGHDYGGAALLLSAMARQDSPDVAELVCGTIEVIRHSNAAAASAAAADDDSGSSSSSSSSSSAGRSRAGGAIVSRNQILQTYRSMIGAMEPPAAHVRTAAQAAYIKDRAAIVHELALAFVDQGQVRCALNRLLQVLVSITVRRHSSGTGSKELLIGLKLSGTCQHHGTISTTDTCMFYPTYPPA